MQYVSVGLTHYLVVSALLFGVGLFAVITRRHAVAVLLGIELMLNAANVNLAAFSRYGGPGNLPALDGQVFALVVIALAACEAAIGLAIIISVYRTLGTANPDDADKLKW